jgi:ABC-type molybdate transport system substrate-binding protein
MSLKQKILFYFIPVFCLLFLGIALWQSQRGEHSAGLSLSPVVLSVYCDHQLEDAAEAILAAYQRRSQTQVDLISVAPEDWAEKLGQLAPGALLLSLEILPGQAAACSLRTHPLVLARAVPLLSVKPELAGRLHSWQDFCFADLRLAMPAMADSALGCSVTAILRDQGLGWEDVSNKTAYRSNDGDYLVRSIALEKADAAIVWESNARHYSSLVRSLIFPGNEKYAAELSLHYLPAPEASATAQRQLINFLTGSLATESWRNFGYQPNAEASQSFCSEDCD